MYVIDPSGSFTGYFGAAIGKAKQNAKTEIEKLKVERMTCRELVKEVSKIIHTVHDEVCRLIYHFIYNGVGLDDFFLALCSFS